MCAFGISTQESYLIVITMVSSPQNPTMKLLNKEEISNLTTLLVVVMSSEIIMVPSSISTSEGLSD